jgi:hypothetical protein
MEFLNINLSTNVIKSASPILDKPQREVPGAAQARLRQALTYWRGRDAEGASGDVELTDELTKDMEVAYAA